MSDFWRGRRIFLTGHTGFKGSWLALLLMRRGALVAGFSLPPPSEPSLFEVAAVAGDLASTIGDIRDPKALATAMQAARPDVVFHLAAQPIVRRSYMDPTETYAVNVMGTVNLFEAVRAMPSVRAVVNVTSDKCYENPEWNWGCRETDPMGGHDPYSSSKGCAELVTAAYRRSFFAGERRVALASARAGNVIGGGDWASDRLLPDMARGMVSGASTAIRNPDSVRPWQHVLEPLSGYMLLAERLRENPESYAEGWNFGPAEDGAVPVRTVLEIFAEASDGQAQWHVHRDNVAPHEAKLLRLDIAKARAKLGWRPRWGLETAVRRTAEWYATHRTGGDMRRLTLAQIDEYEAAA